MPEVIQCCVQPVVVMASISTDDDAVNPSKDPLVVDGGPKRCLLIAKKTTITTIRRDDQRTSMCKVASLTEKDLRPRDGSHRIQLKIIW